MMSETDERIIRAIQQASLDPEYEPRRFGEPESDNSDCNDSECEDDDCSEETLLPTLPSHSGRQTGPKGVLDDYKHHQRQQKELQKLEYEEFIQKLERQALSGNKIVGFHINFFLYWVSTKDRWHRILVCFCSTDYLFQRDYVRIVHDFPSSGLTKGLFGCLLLSPDKTSEEQLEELDDEEFLKLYRQKRLNELQRESNRPTFGTFKEIGVHQYVDAIEKEHPDTLVLIHLYDPNNSSCRLLNRHLTTLSHKYGYTKFLRILYSDADPDFDVVALPTILGYKSGDLMVNLVRIVDEFEVELEGRKNRSGEEFGVDDVERCLIRHNAVSHSDLYSVSPSTKLFGLTGHNNQDADDDDE
ncbi:thioredoxin-like protein [Paraphysoderma sedebokerense]|nr:thioredoxin-like protein [Paraphysoderma sedebokerense]